MTTKIAPTLEDVWLDGYRAGVRMAAAQVKYHCDCKHADVPGLVRLLIGGEPLGVNADDARLALARLARKDP